MALNLSINKTKNKKERKSINVTFKENKTEEELYEWLKTKGAVGSSVAGYIKQEMYKIMQKEKQDS